MLPAGRASGLKSTSHTCGKVPTVYGLGVISFGPESCIHTDLTHEPVVSSRVSSGTSVPSPGGMIRKDDEGSRLMARADGAPCAKNPGRSKAPRPGYPTSQSLARPPAAMGVSRLDYDLLRLFS